MAWLNEPVPIWALLVLIGMLWFFKWRVNDKARALIASRLEEIEDKIDLE